jgi:peroxin-6
MPGLKFNIYVYRFRLNESLNLQEVADACPLVFTGADFYALCSDAMLNAVNRTIQNIDTAFG